MAPLSTLLLCLPAALPLIACGCSLAALWFPPAPHAPARRPAAGLAKPP